MTILIVSLYSFDSYSRGIMPDLLQTQIDRNPGARIIYLTNSNSFNLCYFNLEKRPENCYRCTTGLNNALKLIAGKFDHLTIRDIISEQDYSEAENFFKTQNKVSFDQVYENFEVGAATLSTYISRSRDRDLVFVKQAFVKELAVNALALYLATRRFLKENKVDVVYNFNGRHEYVRAIMRASMAVGLNCYNVERARIGGFLEYFKNVLPHNIQSKKQLVDACWEGSELSYDEKVEISENFFKRQRGGESVIFQSYTKKQSKNALPRNISTKQKNIVLFNSSDDEYAALGDDFKNPVFKDQFEGIEFLVDLFGKKIPGYNLIIRMHPNLAEVKYDYAENIRRQHQKYPNIYVVLPEDKTDSYALLEIAEKVVTFGSTLGLEATYYGKPSILLGKCFHYYSNVAYTPQNRDEIFSLLTQEIDPKPKENTYRFGFYYLSAGKKAKYYYEENIGEGVYFKDKRIHFFSLAQRINAKIIEFIHKFLGKRMGW